MLRKVADYLVLIFLYIIIVILFFIYLIVYPREPEGHF